MDTTLLFFEYNSSGLQDTILNFSLFPPLKSKQIAFLNHIATPLSIPIQRRGDFILYLDVTAECEHTSKNQLRFLFGLLVSSYPW